MPAPVSSRLSSPPFGARPGPFSKLRPGDHIVRAAAAHLRSAITRERPWTVAKELYGENDKPTEILLRAATNPATLTTTGWARELATTAFYDFLVALAPVSAGAALLSRGMQIPMGTSGQVAVPVYVTSSSDAGSFVAEGTPIPARNLNFNVMTLAPHKLAVLNTFTNELAAASNIEPVIRQVVGEAMALAIDAEIFSSNIPDATRPGGIMRGMSSLLAKSGGGAAAFAEDAKTLIDELAKNGGGRRPVFVCSPATAAAAKNWASVKFDYEILSSSAIAKNSIVAIELDAFASAFSPIPEFSVSTAGVLQQEGASPLPPPAPGTISLWQAGLMSLKTIVHVCWGMRSSGLVQQIQSVSW